MTCNCNLEGQRTICAFDNMEDICISLLIEQARQGDHVSMGQLAEVAEARLLPYIYRLTLNYDLTQELCQQSLAKMVQCLNELNDIDCFWPWLYRSAMGQVQHHYRDIQRQRLVEMAALNKAQFCRFVEQDHADGLTHAQRSELAEIVIQGIEQLHLTYRNVLILRCYENLSYAEIAQQIGCKDLHAKVLFYRAKKMLKKYLGKKGFGPDTLLTALGLFGLMTVPTKSTSIWTVQAASLQTGFLAVTAATLCSRIGVLMLTGIPSLIALIQENKALAWFIICVGLISYIVSVSIDSLRS